MIFNCCIVAKHNVITKTAVDRVMVIASNYDIVAIVSRKNIVLAGSQNEVIPVTANKCDPLLSHGCIKCVISNLAINK